jgi:large subunit ribosomal protein L15
MIHNLPSPKTKQKSKKIGRGMGSGVGGHTAGRGGKGQTARGGHKSPRPIFEGGQNPISRRLPRYRGIPTKGHGYTSRGHLLAQQKNSPVKLSLVAETAKAEKVNEISIATLVELGLIKPKFSKDLIVKVLFDKAIDYKLDFKGVEVSKNAKAAIEKAGGSVE